MKTLTYYDETRELLRFIEERFSNCNLKMIRTILIDAKEEIENQFEIKVPIKDLNRQDKSLL